MKWWFRHGKDEEERFGLRSKMIESVAAEVGLSRGYLLLLLGSSVIATLGVLTDSATVVIGAMLISPLFWPPLGLSLGLITTKRHLASRSVVNLVVSVALVLVVAYVVTLVVPIDRVGFEVTSRANPTLLDLFVALASAVIGVLAIYHPRISHTATGVAISIALLPALAVAGVGVALGSREIFNGAFLLFGANTGAIVFSGAITLYLLGFRPKQKRERQRLRWGLLLSFLFLVVLSVPLSLYLRRALVQAKKQEIVAEVLAQEFEEFSKQASLEGVAVQFETGQEEGVVVEGTVYLPEGGFVTAGERSAIISRLSRELKETVDLQLKVVNTLKLRRQEDEMVAKLRGEVEKRTGELLEERGQNVERVRVDLPEDLGSDQGVTIEILAGLKQFGTSKFGVSDKKEIEEELTEELAKKVSLEIELLPVSRLVEADELEEIRAAVRDRAAEWMIDYEGVKLAKVETGTERIGEGEEEEVVVTVWLEAAEDVDEGELVKEDLTGGLDVEFDREVKVEVRLVRYESL